MPSSFTTTQSAWGEEGSAVDSAVAWVAAAAAGSGAVAVVASACAEDVVAVGLAGRLHQWAAREAILPRARQVHMVAVAAVAMAAGE